MTFARPEKHAGDENTHATVFLRRKDLRRASWMNHRWVCALGIVGVLTMTAQAADSDATRSLRKLFDDYEQWRRREFPQLAMSKGDYRYADRITDQSLEAIERRHRDRQRFLDRLHAIDRGQLGGEDRLNYDLFELILERDIEGHRYRAFLMPVSGRNGPHQTIAQMHLRVRFEQPADFESYLRRLEQTPTLIDQTIAKMRQGMREKRVPPKITVAGVPEQCARLVAGGLRVLRTPLAEPDPHAELTEAQRAALLKRFDEVVFPQVKAAIERFGRFVEREYLPACRDSIAATDLPDGKAYYAYMLRTMTTTDLTAEQIHQIGLSEVRRIRAEMMRVIRQTDYLKLHPESRDLDDDALFAAFVTYLRTDPRFYCKTPDELLMRYRDICKRIDATLPKLFWTLPRLPYGVKAIPAFMAPHQTTAYYSPGDIRNAEPGYFYANTYALDQRPTYEMVSLAMHEAVPGHHLQIALAQELRDVPEFRRDAWFTAFGEGWALYSERLGLQVGLYDDPYSNFGRLLYEMWRACRLVVDPGMHALGWSREQAIAFMERNTALSKLNIRNEIDRYIAWPGQACAYKIGELKIRELRRRAEQALGETFDLRRFHDVVLGAGSIPLSLLEKRVEAWIVHAAAP